MSNIETLEYIRKLESRVSKLERQELSYWFIPLTTPLTSNLWDGDARSTTAKTLIDLSNIFGAPANIKAVSIKVTIRDSSSSASTCWMILSPNNTDGSGKNIGCTGLPNDEWAWGDLIVPCDTNGDIYYQCNASGAGTLDVWLQIWGYWV